ncbi:hypothetical protein GGS20DRAFT_15336 [Poronia punctata]|nr:hypothetical protein GGS20DRAFT_15336 [Poronia punctata]
MSPLLSPQRTTLAIDPTKNRKCSINGYAFQQDAIHTYAGFQFACFYARLEEDEEGGEEQERLYVHLSRRKLPSRVWDTIIFKDYAQTEDDGHNTVQLGICPSDSTIHLTYDHHCSPLHYRHSLPGAATVPSEKWDVSLFGTTLTNTLPGLQTDQESNNKTVKALLNDVTYPRFLPLPNTNQLLLTFRTGKAGLGDDHLFTYSHGKYTFLGTHLRGIRNNPYIHGLSISPPSSSSNSNNKLVTTWVYRAFVPYLGWDDPLDTKHKQQAGPNSAENNHDICCAYSEDGGVTWYGGGGRGGKSTPKKEKGEVMIANLSKDTSILPTSSDIVAFEIPKGAGLMNQESQTVDYDGGIHVLNRDCLDDGGKTRWKHYYSDPLDGWMQRILPHVDGACGGKRGQVAVSREGDLYFVLPHHTERTLTILKASKESRFAEYELVWQEEGFPPTDPLVDKARLLSDNVLSVLTKSLAGPGEGVMLTVLDFPL